jgi:putative peptidoglycan lipid II flippase
MHALRIRPGWARRPGTRALFGTIIGSGPGLILPFVISLSLGAGTTSDSYFYAVALAVLVSGLLDAVTQANLVPVLAEEERRGRWAFRHRVVRVAREAKVGVGVAYLVVVALAVVLQGTSAGWSSHRLELTLAIAGVLGLFVLFAADASVSAAALYVRGRFLLPTASLAFRSVVPLVAIVVVGSSASTAVLITAAAVVVGEGTRAAVLRSVLHRDTEAISDAQPAGTAPTLWAVALPQALATGMAALTPAVDRAFASSLAPGSVTVLDLAEKLMFVPMTAMTAVFIVVAGPRWSRMTVSSVALRVDFFKTVRTAVAMAMGATVLLAGGITVATIVGGDTFFGAPSSVLRTVTLILAVGVVPAVVSGLGARLIAVTRNTRLLPALGAVNLIGNAVGNYIGVNALGLNGIVLASTCTRVLLACLYFAACVRLLRQDGTVGRRVPDA